LVYQNIMTDEIGNRLWARLCASVTRWGQPRPVGQPAPLLDFPEPSKTLDLHGMTIHVACAAAKTFLTESPHRDVIVITGKSGQISYEFPDWCHCWPRVTTVTQLSGGGAYRVRLRPL
jgi:hypothetical protein